MVLARDCMFSAL